MAEKTIDVTEITVNDWLTNDIAVERKCIEIPEMYQRLFAWEKSNCEALWGDIKTIMDKLTKEETDIEPHFLGTILISQKQSELDGIKHVVIADGQQRITALSIFLKAAYDEYLFKGKVDDGIKLNFEQLLYRTEKNKLGKKKPEINYSTPLIRVSNINKEMFLQLFSRDNEDLLNFNATNWKKDKNKVTSLLAQAYSLFREHLKKIDIESLEIIPEVLDYLIFVVIKAKPSQLQHIFETANSLGVDLAPSELAKNFITIGLEDTKAREIYEKYWQYFDEKYNKTSEGKKDLGDVLYYSLSAKLWPDESLRAKLEYTKTSSSPVGSKPSEIYKAYKAYLNFESKQQSLRRKPSNQQLSKEEQLELQQDVQYQVYEKYSSDFYFTVKIKEAMIALSKANIQASESFVNNDTMQTLLSQKVFAERHITANFLWTLLKLWTLLDEEGLARRTTFYWIINNYEFFIGSNPKEKLEDTFFESVSKIISSFFLRGWILLNSGIGSGEENKILLALQKARDKVRSIQPEVESNNREARETFLTGLKESISTNTFMNENQNSRLKDQLIIKYNYSTKLGKFFIRYLSTLVEDMKIMSSTSRGNETLWITREKANIEHIYPQNSSNWTPFENENEDSEKILLNSFGNLTILSPRDNSDAGNNALAHKLNKTFNEKLSVHEPIFQLANPNKVIIPDDISKTDNSIVELKWDRETIENRAKIVAELFIEKILLPFNKL